MKLALKLPRRNPDAPRLSLRERYDALKGSAAKVIGKPPKPARWPRLEGGGRPSKPLTVLITAHNLAYARCLENMNEGGADLAALRAAEEEAFRALLHAPLTSDADRGSYAAAVIERENGFLVRGYAGTRSDPLSIAYRNLRFGEYASEPAQEAEAAADPILAAIAASYAATEAFDAFGRSISGVGMTKAQREREDALNSADLDAQKAVWQTVPTTPAGRRALVDYARARVTLNTHESGEVDDAEYLLGLVLDAFEAMVNGEGQGPSNVTTPARFDAYDRTTGLVTYADAAGKLSTKPTADWLSFMAMRLHHVARSELSRRFDAESAGLDGEGCDSLYAKLQRELRTDAAFALAFHPEQAFAEAQAARDGDPSKAAKLSADKVDLNGLNIRDLCHLYEAYQVANFHWMGVTSRPSADNGFISRLSEFEDERASWVMTRIEGEIAKRTPDKKDEEARDDILSIRVQHELKCNGRIHDNALLLDISRAWIV